MLPRQLRPFTSAPDVGNGPQSPGNHYIMGSVDLLYHGVGGLKGIPPFHDCDRDPGEALGM